MINLDEMIIIDKEEWLKNSLALKLYLIKINKEFEKVEERELILQDEKSVQKLFTYFKNKFVIGFGYTTMEYILEYLDKHVVKDSFFTYFDIIQYYDFMDIPTVLEESTFKLLTEFKEKGVFPSNNYIYYHPIYNHVHEPFLLESLVVHYKNANFYVVYEGENRHLHNLLNRYILYNEDITLKDLLYIKEQGAKLFVHGYEFKLEQAKYIDGLYIERKMTEKNLDNLYKFLNQKNKYNVTIYYESLKQLDELLKDYNPIKASIIRDYLKKFGKRKKLGG